MSEGICGYLDDNMNPVFCFTESVPHEVERFVSRSMSWDERRDLVQLDEESPMHLPRSIYLRAYTPYKKEVIEAGVSEDGKPIRTTSHKEVMPHSLPLYITKTVVSLGRDRAINNHPVHQAKQECRGNNKHDRHYYGSAGVDDDELRFSMGHEVSSAWLAEVGDNSIEL